MAPVLLQCAVQAGQQQNEDLAQAFTAGALQFKGAVYLLPFPTNIRNSSNGWYRRLLPWEAKQAYVKAETLATTSNAEVIALFDEQRQREYQALSGVVDECEMRLNSIQKAQR